MSLRAAGPAATNQSLIPLREVTRPDTDPVRPGDGPVPPRPPHAASADATARRRPANLWKRTKTGAASAASTFVRAVDYPCSVGPLAGQAALEVTSALVGVLAAEATVNGLADQPYAASVVLGVGTAALAARQVYRGLQSAESMPVLVGLAGALAMGGSFRALGDEAFGRSSPFAATMEAMCGTVGLTAAFVAPLMARQRQAPVSRSSGLDIEAS